MGAHGNARDRRRRERAGIAYSVHEYAHDARASLREGGRGYALEAVEALGIDAARVFKTIVVAVDGRLGIAVVPADAEVDLKAVADALGGRKAAIAPPAEAEKATGYVLGGISPLGTRRALPTVVDASAVGVAHDPRVRRPPRPGDRARGRGSRGADAGRPRRSRPPRLTRATDPPRAARGPGVRAGHPLPADLRALREQRRDRAAPPPATRRPRRSPCSGSSCDTLISGRPRCSGSRLPLADVTAPEAENGNHLNTSDRKIPAIPSAK